MIAGGDQLLINDIPLDWTRDKLLAALGGSVRHFGGGCARVRYSTAADAVSALCSALRLAPGLRVTQVAPLVARPQPPLPLLAADAPAGAGAKAGVGVGARVGVGVGARTGVGEPAGADPGALLRQASSPSSPSSPDYGNDECLIDCACSLI